MRYNNLILRISYGLIIVSTVACTQLSQPTAKLTALDQQYKSIQKNIDQIDGFSPSLGTFINARLITEVLSSEVNATLTNISSDEIVVNSMLPTVALETQGIRITAEFDILETENNIRATGKFDGIASVSTQDDKIIVLPAFEHMNISELYRESGAGLLDPVISAAVKSILKNHIERINKAFLNKPSVIDMNWGENVNLSVNDLFSGSDMSVTHEFESINLYLKQSLLKIDNKGIGLMIELSDTASEGEVEIEPPGDVNSITDGQLKTLYKQYEKRYNNLWASTFGYKLQNNTIDIAVSKYTLSSSLNALLNQKVGISQQFESGSTDFSSTVEMESNKFDCQKAYKPFKRERYKRRSCNWSCQKCVDLLIGEACSDEPVCLTTRAACNTKEEAKVLADNVAHESARVAHQAAQEAEVAACNVAREAVDFLSLGRFDGEFKTQGVLDAKLSNARFNDTLSELSTNLDVAARMNADVKMKITPHDLGHVFFCVAPTQTRLDSRLAINAYSKTNVISIKHGKEDDDIVLSMQWDKIPYTATVTPAPLHSLISNPEFLAKCSAGTSLLGAIDGLGEIAEILGIGNAEIVRNLKGDFAGDYEVAPMKLRIKPIEVELGDENKYKTKVDWLDKAIRMSL